MVENLDIQRVALHCHSGDNTEETCSCCEVSKCQSLLAANNNAARLDVAL